MKKQTLILMAMTALLMSACGNEGNNTGSGGGPNQDAPVQGGNNSGTGTPQGNVDGQSDVDLVVSDITTTPWQGGAKGAYSIIHDDVCANPLGNDGLYKNWLEIEKRKIVVGLGVVVSYCTDQWFVALKQMEQAGFEIVNHSYSHKDLTAADTDLAIEIKKADLILHEKGLGEGTQGATFFAFPYDTSNDAVLTEVKNNSYKGARGGQRGINDHEMDVLDPLEPFKAQYDCFSLHETDGPNCSKYKYSTDLDILNAYVDDAVRSGGWALRELHGIGVGDSWGWVDETAYLAHLDYIKGLVDKGDLWVATPTVVTKYRASRAYCGKPQVIDGNVLQFKSFIDAPGCIEYAVPLTVRFKVDKDKKVIAIDQMTGKQHPLKKLSATEYLVDLDPLSGKIKISHQ